MSDKTLEHVVELALRLSVAEQAKLLERVAANLSKVLTVPHSESEYKGLVDFLDSLIDNIGQDETHPLASLIHVIGTLIEKYEDEHVPEITNL